MRRVLVSVVAVGALGATALLLTQDVTEQQVSEGRHEEKATRADDGGIAYLRAVRLSDGGAGSIVVDTPGCARRVGAGRCVLLDGGTPPILNRYDAALLTGPGCQPVACSVWLGDDADDEEPEILRRRGPK